MSLTVDMGCGYIAKMLPKKLDKGIFHTHMSVRATAVPSDFPVIPNPFFIPFSRFTCKGIS